MIEVVYDSDYLLFLYHLHLKIKQDLFIFVTHKWVAERNVDKDGVGHHVRKTVKFTTDLHYLYIS